jgi:hypothetical protein
VCHHRCGGILDDGLAFVVKYGQLSTTTANAIKKASPTRSVTQRGVTYICDYSVYTVHFGGDLQRDGFGAIFYRLHFSVKPVFRWRVFRIFVVARCRLCDVICGCAAKLTKFDCVCCYRLM